jgi:PIN domain nuclease of toxin-antitoxin system
MADAMIKAPVKEAPLTFEVALESRRIRLPHKDPADRFIAATAKVFQLTLATSDARLLKLAKRGISMFSNK